MPRLRPSGFGRKGLAKSAAREDRDNSQGTVAVSLVDGVAAIAQLKCETDFVAKSDQFASLVQEIATIVAIEGEGRCVEEG